MTVSHPGSLTVSARRVTSPSIRACDGRPGRGSWNTPCSAQPLPTRCVGLLGEGRAAALRLAPLSHVPTRASMKMAAQIMSGMGCTNSEASFSSLLSSFSGSWFFPNFNRRDAASSSVRPSSDVLNSVAFSTPR